MIKRKQDKLKRIYYINTKTHKRTSKRNYLISQGLKKYYKRLKLRNDYIDKIRQDIYSDKEWSKLSKTKKLEFENIMDGWFKATFRYKKKTHNYYNKFYKKYFSIKEFRSIMRTIRKERSIEIIKKNYLYSHHRHISNKHAKKIFNKMLKEMGYALTIYRLVSPREYHKKYGK